MGSKYYCIWEKEDGTNEVIDVYYALDLKKDAIIFTKPKVKGTLYDIENYLKVRPISGRVKNDGTSGQAHLAYYPDENVPRGDHKSTFEYSSELRVFLKAFENINSFKIETPDGEIVNIFASNMKKLYRVTTSDSFVFLKYFVEIESTLPLSVRYKFNNVLGIEFKVTSAPEPIKRKELANLGIPLFEAMIDYPKWVIIPEEFPSDEAFREVVQEVRTTYQNRNYRLQGDFLNEAVIFKENEEKYNKLKTFEDEIKYLKNQIEVLKDDYRIKKNYLDKLTQEQKIQSILLEQEKKKLEDYQNDNEFYEKIQESNDTLNKNNSDLKSNNKKLNIKNTQLISKNKELELEKIRLVHENEKLLEKEEHNTSWFKHIFKKI